MYISQLWPLRDPSSNIVPVVMRTPSSQILVSKYCPPLKGTRVPGGMVDSRAEAGKIPDNPGLYCGGIKKENAGRQWEQTEEQLREFQWPNLGQPEQ